MTAYACARCGVKPREDDTFLCVDCHDDPQRQAETRAALTGAAYNPREARRLLIDMGWAGWNRRIGGSK